MKGKSKYLVLLILLLVICGGLTTYALFRTNKSGNANVNAARWNVIFKNGETEIEDNFNISLNNATWINPLGNVASGKIAPGSQATFYITIDATNTETSVDYTAEIEDSFNETDFDVTLADDSGTIPYSTTSGAMIRQIPIQVVWNGNINDDDNKNSDDLLKRARNITIPIKLTAAQKLLLKYTVNFSDGFGNTISSKKVYEGETVGTLPSNPTKLGYTFLGWYDDPTNGNQVTTETLVNQGMNIYAHWNIKYIAVTFNSNGGSAVNTMQVQEGGTISALPNSIKNENELIGWFDSSDNQLTTSTQIMAPITYTAHWDTPSYANAGQLVYYDPVSTDTCDSSSFSATAIKNGTSTCYKWRKIKETENNVTMQLDHNLVHDNDSNWNSTNNAGDGPVNILTVMAGKTSEWTRVSDLTYEYTATGSGSSNNYGKLSCINGDCTITNTGTVIHDVKARLITKEEWNNISSSGRSLLVENMQSASQYYSSSSNKIGYWTLSPSGSYAEVNYVDNADQYLGYKGPIYNDPGARPVITVPKTEIN